MAKITVTLQGKVLREIMLRPDTVLTVGRDAANDICLENPGVSRRHARIYKHLYPFYVEDLESTNGTFLNGKRMTIRAALNNNDEITIGKHTLVFNDDPADYGKDAGPREADATIAIRKK